MKSLITGGNTRPLFTATVLGKHQVQYFQCETTGFIQTETPYWLNEAYSEAITALDIGLIGRNLAMRNVAGYVIDKLFDKHAKFLDFGGGYGMFVRLMRDSGYNFYRSDPMCANLFAKGFDWDNATTQKAELLTAWEVFEHLPAPRASIEEMLRFSDSILFSTALVPAIPLASADDWWYFIPETGQHVSLYTKESLAYLADSLKLHFFSDNQSIHLFTRRKTKNPFSSNLGWKAGLFARRLAEQFFPRSGEQRSLLSQDFESIRKGLKDNPT